MVSEFDYTFEEIQKAIYRLPDPNFCPYDQITIALPPPQDNILANESIDPQNLISISKLKFYRKIDDKLSNYNENLIVYKWVLRNRFKIVN